MYQDLKVSGIRTIEGQWLESVYVIMSTKNAFIDKTRRNDTTNLWHMRLNHISYHKLNVMIKKSMINGLPKLDVKTDTICAEC